MKTLNLYWATVCGSIFIILGCQAVSSEREIKLLRMQLASQAWQVDGIQSELGINPYGEYNYRGEIVKDSDLRKP